jgi:hypothetical protein
MNREPEGLIASHVTREPIPEEYTTLFRLEAVAHKCISDGMVEKILEMHKLFDEFSNRMPDRVKVVHFKELLSNRIAVVEGICEFLGIPYTDSLNYFTIMGKRETTGTNKNYLSEELDCPEYLLSKEDLNEIHKRKIEFNSAA